MVDKRFQDSQSILVLSTILDLALAFIKVLVGWLANSHALIADGIHSLSDLLTDLMAWFFIQIADQEPDADHPYGHARFETFGTMLLGAILLAVAATIIYDAVLRIYDIAAVIVPGWSALLVAIVSIGTKEWLYRISRITGERVKSNLLIANAWHHRSDAFSSIVVFIGVGGAIIGIAWLEMAASIIVALMIAQIGWKFGRQSMAELVDTALSTTDVTAIQKHILNIEGVQGVHSLRSRMMGAEVLLDIHIQVNPSVSVSEGHHIGEWVTRGLVQEFPKIGDVVFHIDAEDDADAEGRDSPVPIAPLRSEVRAILNDAWKHVPMAESISQVTLHYLNDGINVEIYLPRALLDRSDHNAEDFKVALRAAVRELLWIRQISVWYG
ncbi:MAG: cation diffusion facilitator family transporter [Pseudomonadales bacterium]|jgi:cation diffusion facilitator family transporter|nr:cation diffusion facilitator family transporter [Pseudomonadales bacterium]MDP7358453.1 cation diffusion facilitator family transporter [Pseudomonadales bacterium]|tara:strand:+ start:704 stop:1852 length:1149 start_codon:yes stop_codon:yes gene_type:complete